MHKHYLQLIDSQKLTIDPAQEAVIDRLYLLHMALLAREKAQQTKKWGFFSRKPVVAPRGLYIYGDVGRGKSMLMDLFFDTIPLVKKRRVHFHSFMLEVHRELHLMRKANHPTKGACDPIPPLARLIASQCQLLCFDELQVTDIADAMILGRLFKELFSRGVVMVATSNRAPDDLYLNGLQREHFLGCIALLKKRLQVVQLQARQDYRRSKGKVLSRLYYSPLGAEADQFAEQAFDLMASQSMPEETLLVIQGRELRLPYTAEGVALCSFQELCAQALGAADYMAIATQFKMLILVDIPVLGREKRNEAKRFVTLIDVLYEQRMLCVFTAAAPPDQLYPEGDGAFEFQRTASRLLEMQSDAYWEENQ